MIKKEMVWVGGVVALIVALLWHYRAPIGAAVTAQTAPQPAAKEPDVLYRWVDKQGVTHYEQAGGKGARTEYDGSRITALTPLTAEQKALLAAARAREEAEAAAQKAEQKGSELIHEMRQELQEDAAKMQAVKDARRGI